MLGLAVAAAATVSLLAVIFVKRYQADPKIFLFEESELTVETLSDTFGADVKQMFYERKDEQGMMARLFAEDGVFVPADPSAIHSLFTSGERYVLFSLNVTLSETAFKRAERRELDRLNRQLYVQRAAASAGAGPGMFGLILTYTDTIFLSFSHDRIMQSSMFVYKNFVYSYIKCI